MADQDDDLIPQKLIQSAEMERLVRAMADALNFLTAKVDKPARIQNALRVEEASSVLGIALMPYHAELVRLHAQDRRHCEDLERRLKFRTIDGGSRASK